MDFMKSCYLGNNERLQKMIGDAVMLGKKRSLVEKRTWNDKVVAS